MLIWNKSYTSSKLFETKTGIKQQFETPVRTDFLKFCFKFEEWITSGDALRASWLLIYIFGLFYASSKNFKQGKIDQNMRNPTHVLKLHIFWLLSKIAYYFDFFFCFCFYFKKNGHVQTCFFCSILSRLYIKRSELIRSTQFLKLKCK